MMTAARRIDDEQRRWALATSHRLAPAARIDDVVEITDSLVALHSSDPVTVHLSALARMRQPDLTPVERALYDDRTLIRHHAMRQTLWVMTPDLAVAAHAGFTRKVMAAERRRTAKMFGHDDGWVADGIRRLAELVKKADGTISTRELGELATDLTTAIVVRQGKHETRIAPHSRLMMLAAMEGRICRARPTGTWVGSQYRWSSTPRWLALDWDRHSELDGAMLVVDHWLRQFGPGTLRDLTWWTGGTQTLVRRALERIGAEQVELTAAAGFIHPEHEEPADPGPWVAMLPGLDASAMGWKLRDWYLAPEVASRTTDRNGNIGPTVWIDGRVVGGWVQRPDGTIVHDVDGAELDSTHQTLLDHEIERLHAALGDSRFRVRFPAPNQPALLGA